MNTGTLTSGPGFVREKEQMFVSEDERTYDFLIYSKKNKIRSVKNLHESKIENCELLKTQMVQSSLQKTEKRLTAGR